MLMMRNFFVDIMLLFVVGQPAASNQEIKNQERSHAGQRHVFWAKEHSGPGWQVNDDEYYREQGYQPGRWEVGIPIGTMLRYLTIADAEPPAYLPVAYRCALAPGGFVPVAFGTKFAVAVLAVVAVEIHVALADMPVKRTGGEDHAAAVIVEFA